MSLQEEEDVDLLNLNTYDDFDLIILVLCLCVFACLFTCYGWCLHKICVYNKVAGNTDADVETLSTKLSMTQRGKAADFFRGLSIRAGLTFSNINSKRSNSKKRSPNVVKWQPNLTSINECKHNKRAPKSTTLNLPPQPNMEATSGDEVEMNGVNKMKKTDSESILNVLDATFATHSKNKTLKKRFSLQATGLPTPGLTPGLPSPGSNVQSGTHVSMNIPYQYSDNPYKTAAKTQNLVHMVSITERNGNNDGMVILDHAIDEDAIDATTPLTTPL